MKRPHRHRRALALLRTDDSKRKGLTAAHAAELADIDRDPRRYTDPIAWGAERVAMVQRHRQEFAALEARFALRTDVGKRKALVVGAPARERRCSRPRDGTGPHRA